MTDSDRNSDYQWPRSDDEINPAEFVRTLWNGKWLLSGITVLSTVIALIVALMLPNIYRSEVVLMPNQSGGASGLSALAAQYSGLARLAGIDLGGESADKTALGLQILKSRKFIADFVKRHDLLVPLMAAEGWDLQSGELQIDAQLYDVAAKKWVRKAVPPRTSIPSRQEAYEAFNRRIFSVVQDKKTGFVTIAVQHYSPTVAKEWVDWLVEDINATVMRQEVDEAEQAIAYLEEQIAATPLADLQNVFYRLIEAQTKTVMLAKVSPEYIFRTVDPAVVPELKAKPHRALIAVIGLILGGVIGVSVVLARGSISPNRT